MAAPVLPGEADPPPRLAVAVDDLGSGLWGGKIKQVGDQEAALAINSIWRSRERRSMQLALLLPPL